MLRVLSLFSGIGAFEVALDELNIEWCLDHYCEIDKYASQAYNAIHFTDDSYNLKDVTNVDYSKIGDIDLITYGFPCQDISLAGNQKGFYDEDGNLTRSGLFFNAADIIAHTKPKFAIFENVKNLTSKKFKKEFETVLSVLDELGYNTYWQVLNTKDYGIPQNRERVFGISIRKDIDRGYVFPQGVELMLRLKDMLEEQVDEKYYLSQEKTEKFIKKFIKKFDNEPSIKELGFIKKSENGTQHQSNTVYDAEGIARTLTAVDYKAPLKIVEPVIKQVGSVDLGNNESNNRVYDIDGLSPTLNTMQGGHRQPKIIVKEATKKGYVEAEIGDSINLEQPNSKTRRGRVGKGVAQTLTTSCNQVVVEPLICASRGRNPDNPSSRKVGEPTEQRIEINKKGLANILTTVQKDNYVLQTDFRIRKLTPRECWRLMGFKDKYFDRVKGVSNTQLYKQAGNSIVVDVLKAIFEEMSNQYPEYFTRGDEL